MISDRQPGRRLRCRCADCHEYESVHEHARDDVEAALRQLAEQLDRRYGMRLFSGGAGNFGPPATRA